MTWLIPFLHTFNYLHINQYGFDFFLPGKQRLSIQHYDVPTWTGVHIRLEEQNLGVLFSFILLLEQHA